MHVGMLCTYWHLCSVVLVNYYVLTTCIDTILWKHLSDDNKSVSSQLARKKLDQYFGNASNTILSSSSALQARRMTVVLIDEIDYLKTKDDRTMYDFCNWPVMSNSKLFIIGVANTIDLLEQQTARNVSRAPSGPQLRLVFPPYSYEQMAAILVARLGEFRGIVMDENAIVLTSRKAAAAGGDVRRALNICQR